MLRPRPRPRALAASSFLLGAVASAALIACAGKDTRHAASASTTTTITTATATATAEASTDPDADDRDADERAFLNALSRRRAIDSAFLPTIRAPGRPAGEVEVIDYAALPLSGGGEPISLEPAASFEVLRRDMTSKTCPPGSFAPQKITWFMTRSWSTPAVVQVGATTLPSMTLLDGAYQDASGRLDGLLTGPARPARWLTLDDAHRTGDAADATIFEGSFDPKSRRAVARSKRSVEARAVVPGIVYAYRTCVEGCDEPLETAGRRVEELGIVAPASAWLGTSGAPIDAAPTDFTWLSARVSPGSSASLLVATRLLDLDRFRGTRAPVAPHEPSISSFSIDVVWEPGSAPQATLFRAGFDGVPEEFAGSLYTSAYDQPPCLVYGDAE